MLLASLLLIFCWFCCLPSVIRLSFMGYVIGCKSTLTYHCCSLLLFVLFSLSLCLPLGLLFQPFEQIVFGCTRGYCFKCRNVWVFLCVFEEEMRKKMSKVMLTRYCVFKMQVKSKLKPPKKNCRICLHTFYSAIPLCIEGRGRKDLLSDTGVYITMHRHYCYYSIALRLVIFYFDFQRSTWILLQQKKSIHSNQRLRLFVDEPVHFV